MNLDRRKQIISAGCCALFFMLVCSLLCIRVAYLKATELRKAAVSNSYRYLVSRLCLGMKGPTRHSYAEVEVMHRRRCTSNSIDVSECLASHHHLFQSMMHEAKNTYYRRCQHQFCLVWQVGFACISRFPSVVSGSFVHA